LKEVLRQERKYLITREQFHKFDTRYDRLLVPDEHNGHFGYLVRTLYFDTIDERDFYQREEGVELRRKIRLRTYDPDNDFAMLEVKQKHANYQKKRSLRVSREDAIALTEGDYQCLIKMEDPFAKECYAMMMTHTYRPKSIVEYNRKAYIAHENKIRITFDSNIRATESSFQLFDKKLNMNQVFDPYLMILEVKYNGFMLSYIKDIISMDLNTNKAASKYCLSRSSGLHYVFQ